MLFVQVKYPLNILYFSCIGQLKVPDVNIFTGEVEEDVEGAPPDDAPVRVLGAGHAAVLTAHLPGPS